MQVEYGLMFALWLTLGVFVLLPYRSTQEVPCDEQYSGQARDNPFIENPVVGRLAVHIKTTRQCYIYTNDVYQHITRLLNEKKTDVDYIGGVVLVEIQCMSEILVTFREKKSSDLHHVIFVKLSLTIFRCLFSHETFQSINSIGNLVHLRLQLVAPNSIFCKPVSLHDTDCAWGSTIQSIDLLFGDLTTPERHSVNFTSCGLLFFESCEQVFSNVTIFSMQNNVAEENISLNTQSFEDTFPSVSSLILRNIQLFRNITFPWKHEENAVDVLQDSFKLFYDSQNSLAEGDIFLRNSIHLNGCKINTTNINIEGYINSTALTQMGLDMYTLHIDFFKNVTVLDTIDLSFNNFEYVDPSLFLYQHQLKCLYLNNNKLIHLDRGVFRDLMNLRSINLANNRLTRLQKYLFRGLRYLKVINLKHNLLTQLADGLFIDQTQALSHVWLSYNPLKIIPMDPLYSRSLRHLDLQSCSVTGASVVKLTQELTVLDMILQGVDITIDDDSRIFGGNNAVLINLSDNKISTIPSKNMTVSDVKRLVFFVKRFRILLKGNPVNCNCDTTVLNLMYGLEKDSYTDEDNMLFRDFLLGFVCKFPSELKGRQMASVRSSEKYCPVNVSNCPFQCKCFLRYHGNSIIVDCRNQPLQSLPQKLPEAILELWFQNASITKLELRPYLRNVTVFNLSKNKIKTILPDLLTHMYRLTILNFDSNRLEHLPMTIKQVNVSLTLSGNHFVCDCQTLWTKRWILSAASMILDMDRIKCIDSKKVVSPMISVPDSSFICMANSNFDFTHHALIQTLIACMGFLVALVILVVLYVNRFSIKALLFLYFNIRVFHQDDGNSAAKTFDGFWIHEHDDNSFSHKIISALQNKGYTIATLSRNAIVGYSVVHNIKHLARKSRRMIVCFPLEFRNDTVSSMALKLIYTTKPQTMTSICSRLIIVADKYVYKQNNADRDLRRCIKHRTFVDRNSNFLTCKIEYLMPRLKNEAHGHNSVRYETLRQQCARTRHTRGHTVVRNNALTHVHVFYPDAYHERIKDHFALLQAHRGINMKPLIMEFLPGTDITEELVLVLACSEQLIYVIDNESLRDELAMFILTQAILKTLFQDGNYLILCIAEDLDSHMLGNHLAEYLKNYTTINLCDLNLNERILQAISDENISYVDPSDTDSEGEIQSLIYN